MCNYAKISYVFNVSFAHKPSIYKKPVTVTSVCGKWIQIVLIDFYKIKYARGDSNPRPSASEADALSG